jgi:hypothetical protein
MFATKVERDSHFRGQCQPIISLTSLEGSIRRVERTDGKFTCPSCLTKYSRSDNLISHWKECKTRDGTESNSHYLTN